MIPVKIKAIHYIPNATAPLCRLLGAQAHSSSLALVTTDCDDATYIALDEATKAADVTVCYGRSFYAGAANASTPNTGEVIGILCGKTPGSVRSGMDAVRRALERIGFEETDNVPYLAYTVSSCGHFLAAEAEVPPGSSLAYLIAPPLESMVGLDAALKAADVRLCKGYPPPTQTNFGGGLLTGTQSACKIACEAFADAIKRIAAQPIEE